VKPVFLLGFTDVFSTELGIFRGDEVELPNPLGSPLQPCNGIPLPLPNISESLIGVTF
jgi:hypothetical protein